MANDKRKHIFLLSCSDFFCLHGFFPSFSALENQLPVSMLDTRAKCEIVLVRGFLHWRCPMACFALQNSTYLDLPNREEWVLSYLRRKWFCSAGRCAIELMVWWDGWIARLPINILSQPQLFLFLNIFFSTTSITSSNSVRIWVSGDCVHSNAAIFAEFACSSCVLAARWWEIGDLQCYFAVSSWATRVSSTLRYLLSASLRWQWEL